MNGDLLGRVSRSDSVYVCQFVIKRNAFQPDLEFEQVPFLAWVFVERAHNYERPPKCKCRTVFRLDRPSHEKWYEAFGQPPNIKINIYTCRCFGDFLE